MPQLLEWLEATSIGLLVRESVWGFPIVVAIHIMGLMLSVGLLVWFDLRLLGGDLRPKTFFLISTGDENFFANFDLEYHLGDNLAFAAGAFWFEGYSTEPGKNRYTPLGAFEDSSHVYLRLTAWY